jgi:hypothetical protein
VIFELPGGGRRSENTFNSNRYVVPAIGVDDVAGVVLAGAGFILRTRSVIRSLLMLTRIRGFLDSLPAG